VRANAVFDSPIRTTNVIIEINPNLNDFILVLPLLILIILLYRFIKRRVGLTFYCSRRFLYYTIKSRSMFNGMKNYRSPEKVLMKALKRDKNFIG
jgi:hypothetical protein